MGFVMGIASLANRLGRQLRRLRVSEDGNVAIIFSLALIPIVGLTGGAIDYSRASATRTAMQAALDATALAMSKDAANLTAADLKTKATAYFNAAFNRPDASNVEITTAYSTTGGSTLTVSGSGTIKTDFLGIIGINTIPIGSSSTTTWGMTRLRVALALDNTGSMADSGKMTALKSATKSLLTQLQNAAANPGDVYVSIVPFAKDVNVGSGNYNADWIDWTDWDSDNGYCRNYWGWFQPQTKSSCNNAGGTWSLPSHSSWNGCVTDRGNSSGPSSNDYDTNVLPPDTSKTASLFPAEQADACPQAIMGLGYNWSAMNTLVNNMSPNGSTNQTIGLVWGWMSLVGGGPLTVPAMDSNYQYTQVIILLSDGLNTQDRWYGNGSDVSSSVDARMAKTCTNVKAAGITIYTIQLNTGRDAQSAVLQNCATDSNKFFYLTSSSQVSGVFNTIGTNLTKLRISK
jgi:Flp pilus assembly protein TadG